MINPQPRKLLQHRILLRRRANKDYYSGAGWTTEPDRAQSFATGIEAIHEYSRLRLNDASTNDMEVVVRLAGSDQDLFITVLSHRAPSDPLDCRVE